MTLTFGTDGVRGDARNELTAEAVETLGRAAAEVLGADTLEVHVVVDVDDRNLVNESGGIFPGDPWHFVYAFNQFLTRDIDVAF